MTDISKRDIFFMSKALEEARIAFSEDEIPIGAVLVKQDEIVFSEHNKTRQMNNPLAHAEKLILDKILAQNAKYLNDYTLYVTLEPCVMCSGMMIWSRLGRLVFAAYDPKAGCVGSIYNVLKDKQFNHSPEICGGVMAEEAGNLLKDFFRNKRNILS
ncbi:MAG: nucleoside deaminase [Candidatus Cloacimonadaceae bacterium]